MLEICKIYEKNMKFRKFRRQVMSLRQKFHACGYPVHQNNRPWGYRLIFFFPPELEIVVTHLTLYLVKTDLFNLLAWLSDKMVYWQQITFKRMFANSFYFKYIFFCRELFQFCKTLSPRVTRKSQNLKIT